LRIPLIDINLPSIGVFELTKVIKMLETVPIPSPPGLPLLGNIADIDSELPVKSFSHLADIYGSFFYFAKGIAEVLDDLLKAILLRRYLVFTHG